MNEIDDVWAANLANAVENARSAGREDIADYLTLKAANNSVRNAGAEQLFQWFIDIALSAENVSRGVAVERESPHSFVHRNANMKGASLRISRGVRCLTVEAGWTRSPSDGFMRLGALVFARITHFGLVEKNEELILKPSEDNTLWFTVKLGQPAAMFDVDDAERHIKMFLDDHVR
jgi:hypothetical protein